MSPKAPSRAPAPKPEDDFYKVLEDGTVEYTHRESKFEPIPGGEYDLLINVVDPRIGKDSGKPFFSLELRVNMAGSDYDNRVIFENISPSAGWRVSQLIDAVYGSQEKREEGEVVSVNFFDFVGETIKARVGIETGRDGIQRNSIIRFLAKGEASDTTISPPTSRKPEPAPAAKSPARRRRPTS